MKIDFRPTTLSDIASLPAIERSAGQRFLAHPTLAWIAGSHVISVKQHRQYVEKGMSWVVQANENPVGFLVADMLDSSLFIAEFSLAHEWQGKGHGRRFIRYVSEQAGEMGLTSLTLTTFRNVAWNAPLYARLGFVMLDDETLPAALRERRAEEVAHGLAYELRCAMRLMLN